MHLKYSDPRTDYKPESTGKVPTIEERRQALSSIKDGDTRRRVAKLFLKEPND